MSKQEAVRYMGTSDPITENEAYACRKYIKKHRASFIQLGGVLLDLPALLRPFHLDCDNCRLVHRETCCEGGQPYAVENGQAHLLDREAAAIARQFWNQREQRSLSSEGIWDKYFGYGTIRMEHGNCLFYKEMNGRYGCSIHAYAEKAGVEVVPLKPFSCQLYPLELIDTGELVLLTALTEETAAFSRWGTDYLEQFYCASLERRQAARHLDGEHFAPSGYKAAYRWNLPLLHAILGPDAEKALDLLHLKEHQQLAVLDRR